MAIKRLSIIIIIIGICIGKRFPFQTKMESWDRGQIKEQLEDLSKQGIQFRFVKTKELDGSETLSIEKEVK